MVEVYKSVDSRLEVSNFGNVRRAGKVTKGTKTAGGYRSVQVVGKTYLIHRLVLIAFDPRVGFEKLKVNHKDGNRANNAIYNIEWCSLSQNSSLPRFKANKGVYHFPHGNKPFRAVINWKGNYKTLGYYKTELEARAAYEKAHIAFYGVAPSQPISVSSELTEPQKIILELAA